MTLTELAKALDYKAHGYLSEIETGKKTPTVGFALSVAELFDVSLDILLKDDLDLDLWYPPQKKAIRSEGVPFVDRPPSIHEVQQLRLILSTYQDGTGMLAKHNRTLPGWRDFERSIALAFSGIASESKDIFDVRLPYTTPSGVYCGISCKMRRELSKVDRHGRVTIELSNSARKFWDHLSTRGIDQANYKQHPSQVGQALVNLVDSWHQDASIEGAGNVDLSRSYYLTLSWSTDGWYQLHQFPLSLPDPRTLKWTFPTYIRDGEVTVGNHLNGDDTLGTLFEWYGESGGELKYYPLVANAIWESDRFRLSPLPSDREHGIIHKVKSYFPKQWADTLDTETE